MSTTAKISTKGFDEYLELLSQMETKDIDAIADKALIAGATVIQKEMQKLVPKDTMNLMIHIALDGPHQEGNTHSIEVGVIHSKVFTDEDTARYGNVMEYGSSSAKAQSYIRPGFENKKRAASTAMKNVFDQELSE